ncbi:DAK2 domain-containing protein [Actinokineospora bangkokensis]|uniref:Dihydroxyacetone kinase n=1 Tax=Actinokineospora bangkokensis TaxID=1193682 RepID=A0A1Q9LI05_9PSEU|nr:DAK2 domain-containing protein [Actinokineospora bangkokensis]OLR91671.1 dihydroxyacetone kinase [Actinokineospora bangkokensis]
MEALDAGAVRRWAAACVGALDAHREGIDRINVYPVADGDTGSNLLGTARAALEALLRAPAAERADAGAAFGVLATGALTGARGNSGVIASQVLRGMAEALREVPEVSGPDLRAALRRGAELARAAMAAPVPGTMVTVVTAAADATGGDGLHDVAAAALGAALVALERTPRQLGALADAGVVDAGGRGVVVLLEALLAVVEEREPDLSGVEVAERVDNPMFASREAGSDLYAYEVMYLLNGVPDEAAAALRDVLVGIGDSVSVVGDGAGLWTVHVHCNDIGAAVEAGVEVGRPRRIRVARFADAAPQAPARFERDRAVVAAVRGPGLAELLRAEGVAVLHVEAGTDPTPYELLQVITGTRAAHVAVLPGGSGLVDLADEAAIRAVAAGQDVVVVPCASPVQALAAVAVHDPRRRPAEDVVAMVEAATATRRGEVVVAAEDAITWVGRCRAQDVLALSDGEVVLVEPGPPHDAAVARAACAVVRRMLAAGGELVTAVLGRDAPGGLAEELGGFLRRESPQTELVVYRGEQVDSLLALGLE